MHNPSCEKEKAFTKEIEKAELRKRLMNKAHIACTRIDEYNKTLFELKNLDEKSKLNKTKLTELTEQSEPIMDLFKAENTFYTRERNARQGKVTRIEEDISRCEHVWSEISESQKVSRQREDVIEESCGSYNETLAKLLSNLQERVSARRPRLQGLQACYSSHAHV